MLLLALAGPAAAQSCTGTFQPLSFGSVRPVTGESFTSSSSLTVTCSGTAGRDLLLCVYAGQIEPRKMTSPAGTSFPFNVYQDAALSQPWSALNTLPQAPAAIKMTLDASGLATQTVPVYAATHANPYQAAGSYTSLPGTVFGAVYDGTSCGQVHFVNDVTKFNNLAVSATVLGSCELSITSINFPSQGLMTRAVTATGALKLTCTSGMPVSVSLGLGQSGATDPANRAMRGPGGSLAYGLFQDPAFTIPWGDQASNDYNIASTPASDINLMVYGRVPVQDAAPGNYADQVLVTLTY